MQYFVYIVRCADDTYYSGYTTDVEKRVDQHNNSNVGAKYTLPRRPVTLKYYEKYSDQSSALKREHQIKSFEREYKELLIESQKKNFKLKIPKTANYKKDKDRALKLVNRRLNHYNKTYKFKYNNVRVKNQKSRWGSCSEKRNLNFNFRIIYLPKRLADYLIVHELCHLGELNHSKKYWELVEKTFPDHKIVRKQMRKIRF
jgi:predicted metal-dependent hydrolase